MSGFDSCSHCKVRGNIDTCLATPCSTHDSWFAQQMIGRSTSMLIPAAVPSSLRSEEVVMPPSPIKVGTPSLPDPFG